MRSMSMFALLSKISIFDDIVAEKGKDMVTAHWDVRDKMILQKLRMVTSGDFVAQC